MHKKINDRRWWLVIPTEKARTDRRVWERDEQNIIGETIRQVVMRIDLTRSSSLQDYPRDPDGEHCISN